MARPGDTNLGVISVQLSRAKSLIDTILGRECVLDISHGCLPGTGRMIEPISKEVSQHFPTGSSFSVLNQMGITRFYNTLRKRESWGGAVSLSFFFFFHPFFQDFIH